MADILTACFGSTLFTGVVKSTTSPADLIGKVLVKSMKLPPGNENGYVVEEEDIENRKTKTGNTHLSRKMELSRRLSDLTTLVSVRYDDLKDYKFGEAEINSVSESQVTKLAAVYPEGIVAASKKGLFRVFPNHSRVDSNNFNPQDFWNLGCQFVSMNFQTCGIMMDLHQGRFRQNGGCGYITKPSIMTEEISFFSAHTRDIIPGINPQILHIRIISAQRLPRPHLSSVKGDVVDPYVTMEIFGIPADCTEERTKIVKNNGYNPIFDESFEFQVNLPELALLRLTVQDDDAIGDDFIGQVTLPFNCLHSGYRHVTLLSLTGDKLKNASLFVHVAVTNKRGGGKPHKRGLSVRRSKKNREFILMRTVHIRSVDDVFKEACEPLKEAQDLREGVHSSVLAFKESCGLHLTSNMKQCIRLLATRVQNSGEDAFLTYSSRPGENPRLLTYGNVPDMLKKAQITFDVMMKHIKQFLDKSDTLLQKITCCQSSGLEFHSQLNSLCTRECLRGRKSVKATENYAWNIRVIRGQCDLLAATQTECNETIKQIKEAVLTNGLLSSPTNMEHRQPNDIYTKKRRRHSTSNILRRLSRTTESSMTYFNIKRASTPGIRTADISRFLPALKVGRPSIGDCDVAVQNGENLPMCVNIGDGKAATPAAVSDPENQTRDCDLPPSTPTCREMMSSRAS